MAKTPISNFRLSPDVKLHLLICSKALGKDMTVFLEDAIEWFYRIMEKRNPAKMQSIREELESQNAAIR